MCRWLGCLGKLKAAVRTPDQIFQPGRNIPVALSIINDTIFPVTHVALTLDAVNIFILNVKT